MGSDQIRVDHGTDLFLMAIQQELTNQHTHQQSPRFIQTTSQNNYSVERLWVEVNKPINYPIKKLSVEIETNEQINVHNESVFLG